MLEKRLKQVSQNLIADGTVEGKITVPDTRLFKVKQKVYLCSDTQQNRDGLEIKRVLNQTEMLIGPEKGSITTYSNLSDFLLIDHAYIVANEQFRPSIPSEEITRAVYEEEPTVALRSMLVDKEGNDYRESNPLPVQLSDGSINIGTVNAELEVQLSHKNNFPDVGDIADSVRIGDGTNEMSVNDDGSINIKGEVTASDFDIRDLTATRDNVAISDGTNTAEVTDQNALKVDGSAVTQPISAVSLPLPAGAATETTLIDIKNKIPSLGQKNMAGSLPVTMALDQTKVPMYIVDSNGNNNDATHPVWVTGDMNASITDVSGFNSDAFGRLRVSEIFTLGDYKHIYGIDPEFIDKTLNGGSVIFSANKSCATMSTSSNAASYCAHQSRLYHNYQPGKSQFILSSVCFGYSQQNVTKRTGYFDDRNGIYFEQVGSSTSNGTNNGQLNFVIRTYTGGSVNEGATGSYFRRVPQASWNKDKCDGTGASGFNINTSLTQLIYIDFQWLGVGRVRCGFVHNGKIIVAHEYYHSNILNTVYISNPNLPVRCEIFNTGATAGGSMDQICSTVSSEGGYIETGIDWSVSSGYRTTTNPGGTELPVIAIRLKTSFNGYPNRISVRPNAFSMYVENNSVEYSIIKLPGVASLSTTLNAGVLTWISADDHSAVEYCINATSYVVANSDKFISGFAPSGSSQNSLSPASQGNLTSAKRNVICQNFDSTDSEIYILVVKTIATGPGTNASVAASIQWREIY